MKTQNLKFLSAVALTAFLFYGCSKSENDATPSTSSSAGSESSSSMQRVGASSVNGQAGFESGPKKFNLEVHATKAPDGTVTGSGEINYPNNFIKIHSDITCFEILPDGKTVLVSGLVTDIKGNSSITSFVHVGDVIYYGIRDNGEGANAPTDEIYAGGALFTGGAPCNFGAYETGLTNMIPISNGNFQVKP